MSDYYQRTPDGRQVHLPSPPSISDGRPSRLAVAVRLFLAAALFSGLSYFGIRSGALGPNPAPMPTESPSPDFADELTPEQKKFFDEVFDAIMEHVRKGEFEAAGEIIRAHLSAKSKGCLWFGTGQVARKDDARGMLYAQTRVRYWLKAMYESDLTYVEIRTSKTSPDVEHRVERGEVEHVIVPRIAVIALGVACR